MRYETALRASNRTSWSRSDFATLDSADAPNLEDEPVRTGALASSPVSVAALGSKDMRSFDFCFGAVVGRLTTGSTFVPGSMTFSSILEYSRIL